MQSIPHSRPVFDAPYQDAVKDIIATGKLAEGAETRALEFVISSALHMPHVLAVDSGTSALMLAIRALAQGQLNPRVGIPAYACASLLFAVKAAGAEPVFMDCNASFTLNADQARDTAKTLDVLVLVHPFGLVEPLAAQTFPCPVIEDIAQSVGATLHHQPVGSFADVCIGSHYATKPWGGAYGGFISSNNAALIETCESMINPDQASLQAYYVGHHQLSNVHAALANVRISQAGEEQQQRRQWAGKYDVLFAGVDATPIKSCEDSVGNDFRYIIRSSQQASAIIQQLRELGIGASRPVQHPLHHSNAPTICPQANDAWQHGVSIPLLADMNGAEWALMQQGIQSCFHS